MITEAITLVLTFEPKRMCEYEQKRFLKHIKKRVSELCKEAQTNPNYFDKAVTVHLGRKQ